MEKKQNYEAGSEESARTDQANPDDELVAAAVGYAKAQSAAIQAELELLKTEARSGFLRLLAALCGILASAVLFLTSWILTMIGLSRLITDWLGSPVISAVTIAGLNAGLAIAAFLFARAMLRKAIDMRPLNVLS